MWTNGNVKIMKKIPEVKCTPVENYDELVNILTSHDKEKG